ncbi:MAG: hypothetical protein ACRDGQ_02175, partial [Candidatus Limnocylindrales bacterium]
VLMLSNPRVSTDRSSLTSLALGIFLGVALGLATSLIFLLIVLGPVLGLVLAFAALRSGIDGRPRAIVSGGLLIGTGSVYLLGALNTVNSCQGQDVCGGTSAVPFLGFAVAVLAVGLLVEGITFVRHP